MKKKYQTHDDRWYKDPVTKFPVSRTDPSQDIPIAKLVSRHVRSGLPAPVGHYGEDFRPGDVSEIHSRLTEMKAKLVEEQALLEKDKLVKAKLERDLKAARIRELVESAQKLTPGSPELAKVSSELTDFLPGVEGGDSPK